MTLAQLHDVAVPNLSSQRQSPALKALGAAIQHLRVERGWSQMELALQAEVDRSYLGRVERGDNNVAILNVVKIAEALDITVAQLMEKAGL
jgi:transcriptional regulator with XRE-family HTH domain